MSSSSTSPLPEYDVFVSFKGDDVIKTFILNLFKRLNRVGINHFEDDDNKGAAMPNEKRLDAIRDARFALVVLSENYVKSQPHRNKLVEILERQREQDLVVIPIFHMDRKKFSYSESKGDCGALAEVEEISGYYELQAANSESKLIDKIVERLVNQINSLYSEKIFTFGPFGGRPRKEWKSGDVKWIRVCYAEFIKSIHFGVEVNANLKPAIKYDEKTRENTFQVILKEGEHVTSFAGYFENEKIKSLIFRTNKRTLGPINRKKEKENAEKKEEEYFFVPSKAGKVVDIFATSNDFLTSIEALVQLPSEVFCPVKRVRFLTTEIQSKWDHANKHSDVSKIIVKHTERFIGSIELYDEKNRELRQSETHGRMVGNPEVIKMNPYEHLTSISGKSMEGKITSLTFRTNKNMIRTIGDGKAGIPFSSPATDGKIVEFYEWSEDSCRGIGANFETRPSKGKDAWDDGKFDGVREIRGFIDQNIRYIKFVYDDGSEKGRTVIHGDDTKKDSSEEKAVKLEGYPREYLTWISGSMRADGSVSSLTFYSNRKAIGSIGGGGEAAEPYFSYPSTGSRIIGFYGTWGDTLNSIGVHTEPIPHLYPFKTIGPFGGSGGNEWDDGVQTAVRGFRVIVSPKNIIQSISFRYDFNGSLVECLQPGEGDAPWNMLDFPKERLAGISFIVDRNKQTPDTPDTTISDLEIHTTNNQLRYAWTGKSVEAGGTSEKYFIPKNVNEDRIVGFFGSKASNLISIGAHLEPYLD